jgi:ABC-type cobalamin/Fe3+-siderophores transport system ATPase subunit
MNAWNMELNFFLSCFFEGHLITKEEISITMRLSERSESERGEVICHCLHDGEITLMYCAHVSMMRRCLLIRPHIETRHKAEKKVFQAIFPSNGCEEKPKTLRIRALVIIPTVLWKTTVNWLFEYS